MKMYSARKPVIMFPSCRRVCERYAKRIALLPQRPPDEARAAAPEWFSGQGAHRWMAATAEQPLGPGPFARMAVSSLVYVSTYIFLTLPCPASKQPTARPFGIAFADPKAIITACIPACAGGKLRSTQLRLSRYQRQVRMHETTDAEPIPASGAAMNAAVALETASAPLTESARPVAATIEAFLASVERRAWRVAEIALRDSDEALDAVQDTMLRLVRHYSAKPAEEWSPLFWGILRRRITDLQRRRTVRNRILVWTGRATNDDDEELPAWEAPDLGPDPSRALASRQAHAAMSKAIRALPRRQQQAFMLRVLEGLDVADTAKAMGCSAGSVKTHLSRAMDALRTQLEDWR